MSERNIKTLTSETFMARVLAGRGPIAVEFMSYGCGDCRVIEPYLQSVAAELGSAETVFRLNIGTARDLAHRYAIHRTPTLVMFLDGAEVGRSAGPAPTLSSVALALTAPFSHPSFAHVA